MNTKYLYHYTSIDTLEKILENKSICFSNLGIVDDLDEVETSDIDKFGRFCYVSCWTREEKESIPMWNMYTPGMQGVRIRLKEFPFKRYVFEPGTCSNTERIETYINLEERNKGNLPHILAVYPQLIEVDYTEKEELLYPKIRYVNSEFLQEPVVEDGIKKTITRTNKSITYETKYIGVFKRKCWAFQKEWRYKIFLAPYTYNELLQCRSNEEAMKLMQRLEDNVFVPKEERVFLSLDEKCIYEMEILVGPKATSTQIEKVKSIIQKAGINVDNIKLSGIRIR